MAKLKVKTLILSDVHLGTPNCKIDEVNHLLKYTNCEKLILNGDIIDGWRLRRSGGWTKGHTRFVRLVLKKLEKKDTHIVYLRGNHDDILTQFLPLEFGGMEIVEEHIHVTPRGRYLVLHGDVFDLITTRMPILSHVGDVGYNVLLTTNRLYNRYRAWRGKDYYSLSKAIKARVKQAVNHISKFEDALVDLARRQDCVGIICGHIHTPADKDVRGVHYLNSGDWVESLTGIVEHHDGRFEILQFADFVKTYPMEDALAAESDEVSRPEPLSAPETSPAPST